MKKLEREKSKKGFFEMGLVLYALTSEKAVAEMERGNRLTFIVDMKATKKQVKDEVEKNYGHKVKRVTTLVTPLGKKKAYVVFEKPGIAAELAAKLKVI